MKPNGDLQIKKTRAIKKEYILAVILAALVIVIYLSGQNINFSFLSTNTESSVDYASLLENKLKNLLTNVNGVGKVNVVITIDGTGEEIILKNVEEKIENNVKTTIQSVVLIGGKPYVTKTENPKIVGVIVVCEGAEDVNVRLAISEIVLTALKVEPDSVRIIKMK